MSDNNHLAPPSSSASSPAAGAERPRSQQSQRSHRTVASHSTTENTNNNTPQRPDYTSARNEVIQSSGGGRSRSGSGSGTEIRRNRSISEPQRPHLSVLTEATPPVSTGNTRMAGVQEETFSPSTGRIVDEPPPAPESEPAERPTRLRRARTNIGNRFRSDSYTGDEYDERLVDLLDTVDPEVGTLTTLTNVQNSLFIPDIPYLGNLINRRPTYTLTQRPADLEEGDSISDADGDLNKEEPRRPQTQRTYTGATLNTISSSVNDNYYAVLPHGVSLPGWTEEEKLELNDHVRHMLHSRRSKFKRGMKGFGQYLKKPLGFLVTLYATLITLFGLAWVLFLIGWINVGGRKDYIINVIDNVLVALFAIMGDGLAPFRIVDTYHMCFIAHYHHLTWRLRRERALPKLKNENDLPAEQPEEITEEKAEFSVLSPEQVRKLAHHQRKFSNSHSFYKPHETATHNAFSLRLLVAIVVLLDCHSMLQISLGACTWGISYHHRPFALTTVILCCSITVNITAGVLIGVGDKKSRKKDVVERMFRQDLTADAIKKVEKKRLREVQANGVLEPLHHSGNLVVESKDDGKPINQHPVAQAAVGAEGP
ncbi:hypothetical protein LHYA1_G008552 [Lachnellula hyalina]|uniref:Integral membrane protein n=1 Tax=Lachnellula hyalina TaxID=1316788 RepID=A0A8H8QUR4_9HELO|nr:uncharacterized protein LHYA1_G008552 [Lachnellula hyalina]TVY23192.1 hypothetical protein LHYA1_G008552 [Lachnellula hyalina]